MATKTQAKPAPKAAAPKTPAAPPTKNVPVTTKVQVPAGVDEALLRAMDEDAGAGISTRASDNIVPLVYVLQAQSPQVLRQKPEYIQGAQAGMFWMRGTKDVIDGDEGMPVIWCHMSVWWFQWGPERGDGLRGRHPENPLKPNDPPDFLNATQVADPKNPKKKIWTTEDGDILVQTREHVVIRVDNRQPYVIPMTSSNHSAARQWMTSAKDKRNPLTGNHLPLYGAVWRLKTVAKSNDQGDWFGIVADDENMLTIALPDGPALYEQAKQLQKDFESGRLVADTDEMSDQSDGGESHEGI